MSKIVFSSALSGWTELPCTTHWLICPVYAQVMQVATPIHDRIMRARISHYNGYEVTTEGDAFIIAFHDPADAVAWCM